MRKSLFRQDALRARGTEQFGSVIQIPGLPLRRLGWGLLTGFALLVACMAISTYSPHLTVGGVLEPEGGVIPIVGAGEGGTVLRTLVREGDTVRRGQVVIEVEASAAERNLPAELAVKLIETEQKIRLLGGTRLEHARLAAISHEANETRRRGLLRQLDDMGAAVAVQARRLEAKRRQFRLFQEMRTKGFLSEIGLEQREDELLDQEARLEDARQGQARLEDELRQISFDLDAGDKRMAMSALELDTKLAELEGLQQALKLQARSGIAAPVDGTVAAVHTLPGQPVSRQPLLSLIPARGRLVANLLVPAREFAALRLDAPVQLKVISERLAKPVSFTGRILSASGAALPGATWDGAANPAAQPGGHYFRVSVLVPDSVRASSGQRVLPGMAVEAALRAQGRSVLSWVLDPSGQLIN